MLSNRLFNITKWIKKESVVADIGTDHALLLIELAKENKLKKGFACDISEGPLNQAKKNIKEKGYEDIIKTILSNGFENIVEDIDTVTIAGLGQNTITNIIIEGKDKLPSRLIISSNTVSDRVRKIMKEYGYKVLYEEITFDKDKFYELMVFDLNEGIEINNYLIGDFNINNQNETLLKYWDKNLIKFKEISQHKNDKILLDNIKNVEVNIKWN